MMRAGLHVEVARRDGPQPLGGVQAVDLGVVGVVQEVGAAGGEAEADERHEGLEQRIPLVEHAGRRRRREHEDVLRPLLGPRGADGRLDDRRFRRRAVRGRLARRIGGRGHRGKGTGPRRWFRFLRAGVGCERAAVDSARMEMQWRRAGASRAAAARVSRVAASEPSRRPGRRNGIDR